jgi:hypothetical protein
MHIEIIGSYTGLNYQMKFKLFYIIILEIVNHPLLGKESLTQKFTTFLQEEMVTDFVCPV